MDWKIPLFKIYWDEDDVASVSETIRRGMLWTIGPNTERFEVMLAQYLGTKYALAFNSGTSALHAVLSAYNIGHGDEVIVPSFTFIATANASLFVGAKPVFADIEEKTYGLDPEAIVRRITPRTKAIIPIHYGGSGCLIEEIREIARQKQLLLIEDAAESLGATVKGKKVATFGDCAILSFCANKVISTGEGGAVVTDSQAIYEKLKLIRSHGRAEITSFFASTDIPNYVALGYNFRMSDITASLGVAQLRKIESVIRMRQVNAARLSEGLSKIAEIEVPNPPCAFSHVYQLYTISVKAGQKKRDALLNHLAKNGIMSKIYFSPVHLTNFYKTKLGYHTELPVTERVSESVLTLPMYPNLTEAEIDYMVDAVESFFLQGGNE